jgi:hypothetical protein
MQLVNKMVLKKDFWVGLAMICFGFLLFNQAKSGPPEIMVFPKVIFYLIMATGAGVVISAIKNNNLLNLKIANWSLFTIVFLIMLIILPSVMRFLGFYAAMAAFTLVLTLMLFKEFSLRKITGLLAYSVILTFSLYLIFSIFLKIDTPNGLLF